MPTVAADAPSVVARPQLWRITDRATFAALRRHGRRTRRGPLTVTYLSPTPGQPSTPPRAGFAVGKATGGAVVRNRVRRRLRAALRELLVTDRLPEGTYLLGATAEVAHLPWATLVATVAEAVQASTDGPA
jgi:ribonuclease P protein component